MISYLISVGRCSLSLNINIFSHIFSQLCEMCFGLFSKVYLQPLLGTPRFRQRLYGERGEIFQGSWAQMGGPAELQVETLPCSNDFHKDLLSAVKNGDETQLVQWMKWMWGVEMVLKMLALSCSLYGFCMLFWGSSHQSFGEWCYCILYDFSSWISDWQPGDLRLGTVDWSKCGMLDVGTWLPTLHTFVLCRSTRSQMGQANYRVQGLAF